MHAGRLTSDHRAPVRRRVKFRKDRAAVILIDYGITKHDEKGPWFGVNPTTYSRVVRGVIRPGEEFIAAVLASHPEDPRITFDNLFEVA